MFMEIFNKILLGYRLLFEFIVQHLNDLFYLLPLLLAACLLILPVIRKLKIVRTRNRFRIQKGNTGHADWKTQFVLSKRQTRNIVNNVAIKLSMFNSKSIEANLQNAVKLIYLTGAIFISLTIIIFAGENIWYMKLVYLLLICFLFYIFITAAVSSIRVRFTSRLPETYKLLNSRYMSQKNILKAIDVSLDDFHPTVRKVMFQISSTLKKNDMDKIERTFEVIDSNYNNEYLSILLILIKQAYYKGGNEAIQEQFEAVTEDILLDIENQRDLAVTTKSYMIGAAIMSPLMLFVIEKFGSQALGASSIEFYSSPQGVNIKIGLLLLTASYIIFMSYLEKVS